MLSPLAPRYRATTLGLALLLASRLALGAAYSLTVPVWEADNEDSHFAYAYYLARYRHLLKSGDPEAEVIFEKFQPPLYYSLIAPFLLAFDLSGIQHRPETNPLFTNGNAGLNYALHPPTLTGFDAEIARAVRTVRLVGVVISTLGVLFMYHLARRIWRNQRGPVWTATILYAFWPQFLFSGSMVTNDLAVTTFCVGVLTLAVKLVADGFQTRRALLLGLSLAGAVLSKINALALLPVAVMAVALSLTPVLHRSRWRSLGPWLVVFVLLAVVAAALAMLTSLPYVTNQVLRLETGELLLRNILTDADARRTLLQAIPYAFRTFLASFGWGNVEIPPWAYNVWTWGFWLGVLGLVVRALRRPAPTAGADARVLLLMALDVGGMLAVTLALVVALNTVHLAPGRYLLPALPAVIGLLVEGWRSLLQALPSPLPARAGQWVWRGVSVGALLLGWMIPLVTILPTYAVPRPLSGSVDVPAQYTFGEAIQLIGHQTPDSVRPGTTADVRVCWQATTPVLANYTVFVEVVGPDGQGYGRLLSYPGGGNFATRFWTPGVPFCDRYRLPIEPAIPAPAQAFVRVALLREPDVFGERLPVTDETGQRVERDFYTVPLRIAAPGRPSVPDHALDYRFEDTLVLRGYSLALEPATRQVRVSLYWEAQRDLDRDYVMFVHLRHQPETAYAQADSQPREGWYPTPLWKQGEVVEDTHLLTLPDGTSPPLELVIGVVDPREENRLVALDRNGERLPDDELVLIKDWVLGDTWQLPATLTPPREAAP